MTSCLTKIFYWLLTFLLLTPSYGANVGNQGEYTVAGFYPVPAGDAGRQVFPFNGGWLFHRGSADGAEDEGYDTSRWEKVCLPHGVEILPEEASGGVNYRGKAWYRKHFQVPEGLKGRKLTLYFEAIMGKCSVWINGKRVVSHDGGYLPVIVDATEHVRYGKDNLVCVMADNADDPGYPPGKPQDGLDFCYFGGIYRDAYLLVNGQVHVTDANEAGVTAGGGVFFRTTGYDARTGKSVNKVKVHVANGSDSKKSLTVNGVLVPKGGFHLSGGTAALTLEPGASGEVELEITVSKTRAWSPESPNLYSLLISVHEDRGRDQPTELMDARVLEVGIRTIRMDAQGLTLNGKPYRDKLIGANRHQDFALLGNAVPNNLQWRDAVKLKQAGMNVVRCAHYPMDPAFMDACDALGLFVIVAAPGWQFIGDDGFIERAFDNVRQMVRRDRNHACVLMWEPILNETRYPDEFAQKVHSIVHEEYPEGGCYTACDADAAGARYFDVLYTHPVAGTGEELSPEYDGKPRFTREFGDNVDDWSSQNSPSRVAMAWGEVPMLIQAVHYLKPPYRFTSWDSLNKAPASHIGGCLWHAFDHQRGYHPDPFYGGLMDAWRQPKISWHAVRSQMSPVEGKKSRAMVYVANACTPFSPSDVTVFTNCDAVRLTVDNEEPLLLRATGQRSGLMHPPVVFEKAWDFMKSGKLSLGGKRKEVRLLAEGLVNGRVMAVHEVRPGGRPAAIRLELDESCLPLRANGSDAAVIIASIIDVDGQVKRLSNETIRFEVNGSAILVGGGADGSYSRPVAWGTAPALLRAGNKPGRVQIRAYIQNSGTVKPTEGTLELEIPDDQSWSKMTGQSCF